MAKETVRACLIGSGGMARGHLRTILNRPNGTEFVVISEPSDEAYAAASKLFEEAGLLVPPNEPDLEKLLVNNTMDLDAAFIVTPHVLHFEQAQACLEAGLDVLLEKPMVMNAFEAAELIKTRDETGNLLVVSFNGSLSPEIRKGVELLRSGSLGQILNVSANVWQNWREGTTGLWRQVPEISGGGFLFDTGAHMLITVTDLPGEDFAEVAAWLDNRGAPVDIAGTIMARSVSGVLVTMNGCGEGITAVESDVHVFCKEAVLRTGVWGRFLELQREGETDFSPVETAPSQGQWDQFLKVREGSMKNPCPPEVGLRMARLWDAVKTSAMNGGVPTSVEQG